MRLAQYRHKEKTKIHTQKKNKQGYTHKKRTNKDTHTKKEQTSKQFVWSVHHKQALFHHCQQCSHSKSVYHLSVKKKLKQNDFNIWLYDNSISISILAFLLRLFLTKETKMFKCLVIPYIMRFSPFLTVFRLLWGVNALQ